MIRITGTRFGDVEVDETSVIHFPNGLVGFPEETELVLLERGNGKAVGFLQSVRTPALAFPVTDGALFGEKYPDPPRQELAKQAGIGGEDLAVLVIVAVARESKTLAANLLAPLIIEVESRRGAQVVLDPRKYDAAAPLSPAPKPTGGLAEAQARIAAIQARSQRDARTA